MSDQAKLRDGTLRVERDGDGPGAYTVGYYGPLGDLWWVIGAGRTRRRAVVDAMTGTRAILAKLPRLIRSPSDE